MVKAPTRYGGATLGHVLWANSTEDPHDVDEGRRKNEPGVRKRGRAKMGQHREADPPEATKSKSAATNNAICTNYHRNPSSARPISGKMFAPPPPPRIPDPCSAPILRPSTDTPRSWPLARN